MGFFFFSSSSSSFFFSLSPSFPSPLVSFDLLCFFFFFLLH